MRNFLSAMLPLHQRTNRFHQNQLPRKSLELKAIQRVFKGARNLFQPSWRNIAQKIQALTLLPMPSSGTTSSVSLAAIVAHKQSRWLLTSKGLRGNSGANLTSTCCLLPSYRRCNFRKKTTCASVSKNAVAKRSDAGETTTKGSRSVFQRLCPNKIVTSSVFSRCDCENSRDDASWRAIQLQDNAAATKLDTMVPLTISGHPETASSCGVIFQSARSTYCRPSARRCSDNL